MLIRCQAWEVKWEWDALQGCLAPGFTMAQRLDHELPRSRVPSLVWASCKCPARAHLLVCAPKTGRAGGKWQFGKAYGLPQTLMLHPGLCFCRIRPFRSCLSCQDVCPALEGSPAEDMFLSCSLINIFTPGRVLAWPAITRSILTLLAAKMLLSPAKVPSLRQKIKGNPVELSAETSTRSWRR